MRPPRPQADTNGATIVAATIAAAADVAVPAGQAVIAATIAGRGRRARVDPAAKVAVTSREAKASTAAASAGGGGAVVVDATAAKAAAIAARAQPVSKAAAQFDRTVN